MYISKIYTYSRWPAFGRPPRGGAFRPAFSWLNLVQVGLSWVIMSQTEVIVGPTGITVGLSRDIVGQTGVIVDLFWVIIG